MAPRLALLALFALPIACARTPVDPQVGGAPGSRSDIVEEPTPDPNEAHNRHKPPEPPHVADDAVERARLPFYGLRLRDAEPAPPDQFLDLLAKANAVCVGEHHDNPHHHWAELQVLNGLLRRAAMGREVGLGLEMVQQPYQQALDEYAERRSDEAKLLEATEWNARWGYSFALYRPLIELARTQHARLVALNAPRELVAKVARGGVAAVDEAMRRWLPELDLDDQAHHAWFEQQMQNHPQTSAKAENRYAAQVVWDESMAEASARWIAFRHPLRQLVILAGAGHCMASAIPKRLRRRAPTARVISVMPVVSDFGDPAKVRAEAKGYDYAFVMTTE